MTRKAPAQRATQADDGPLWVPLAATGTHAPEMQIRGRTMKILYTPLLACLLAVTSLPAQASIENVAGQIEVLRDFIRDLQNDLQQSLDEARSKLDDIQHCSNQGSAYAPNHSDANNRGCVTFISEDNIFDYMQNHCGLQVPNPGSASLHQVQLADDSYYDLWDGNHATATLIWQCD